VAGIFNAGIFNDDIFNTAVVQRRNKDAGSNKKRKRRVVVNDRVYELRNEGELESLLTALVEQRPVPKKITKRPVEKEAPAEVVHIPAAVFELQSFDWSVMKSDVRIDPPIAHMLAEIYARIEDERDIEMLLLH
jgi:hypothetical protein